MVADRKGAVAFLQQQRDVAPGKPLGVIGWCMGGYVRATAQASPTIGPTINCYGSITTEGQQIDQLAGKPLLGIFGADDRGIPVDKVKQFTKLLEAKGSKVELHVYPAAGHAFMRPGGPQYNEKAANDAWQRIAGFLASNLKK